MDDASTRSMKSGVVVDHSVTSSFKEFEQPLFDEKGVGQNAPRDRWNLVYLIILLHGVGVLMPWNMFITIAPKYFVEYKLRTGYNETAGTGTPTWYSENFFTFLGLCSQGPNLLLNLLNVFVPVRGNLNLRILVSLIAVGAVCAFTMVFVYIDTEKWIAAFFWMTMVSIILLNGANGVYQNSVYGLASDFPASFTNAVLIGNNICGVFISLLNIVTIIAAGTATGAAFSYFAISLLTLALCFFSYFYLLRLDFYKYYMSAGSARRMSDQTEMTSPKTLKSMEGTNEEKQQLSDADTVPVVNKSKGCAATWKELWLTFGEGFVQFANVYLVFFVTLALFPAFEVKIRPPTEASSSDRLSRELFAPVTTFLVFNVGAAIGATFANLVQWPSEKHLWIAVLARFLLIPAMVLCNWHPTPPAERRFPVLLPHVWEFCVLNTTMAVTSGYFASLAMMYAPRVVAPARARLAGMMAAFFLIAGIVTGLIATSAIEAIATA